MFVKFLDKLKCSSCSFISMVMKFISSNFPFVMSLTSFSIESHKKALVKWAVLVTAASAPVLLTALLSPVPDGDVSLWKKMMIKLTESMTVSEQFVYCAAFLAPTLYLLWESYASNRDVRIPKSENTSIEKLRNVMKIYRGYGWVFLVSVVILGITAFGFGFIKTGSKSFQDTFMYIFLNEYSSEIYVFSLFAFYLSIVQENGPDGEYTNAYKNDEQEVTDGLGKRVNKGKK